MTDIKVENSSEDYTPAGWKMIFNDEFDGGSLIQTSGHTMKDSSSKKMILIQPDGEIRN